MAAGIYKWGYIPSSSMMNMSLLTTVKSILKYTGTGITNFPQIVAILVES